MAELEKVIKSIEDCVFHKNDCVDCDYDGCVFEHGDCKRDLLADALEMLKELIDERHYYEEWKEGYGKNQQQIVRCKDCKFQVYRGRRYPECDKHLLWAENNWFCADGERKDS